MTFTENICPLDGRYREATSSLRSVWGDKQLMRHRIYVEVKWLEFFVDRIHPNGPLSEEQREALRSLESIEEEDFKELVALEKETAHDVKAVEYFLKARIRNSCLASFSEAVHVLCTSEDINNLAYARMLRDALQFSLLPAYKELAAELTNLTTKWAATPLLARTHGQPASPTTFGKEFGIYLSRVERICAKLEATQFYGKFNGAVGNFNAHAVTFPELDWPSLAKDFVESFGFVYQPLSTQIENHDWIAEFLDLLSRLNAVMSGLAVDCWLYASRGLLQLKRVASEVGSSVMPHKVNPIDFENAEANLGLSSALLKFLSAKLPVSRLQRDLSDSSAMRSIGVALGYSLLGTRSVLRGLSKIQVDEKEAAAELNAHWEILSEAVQSVMRRDGKENPYETLKHLTRGKRLDAEGFRSLIAGATDDLTPKAKEDLSSLTPETYLGLAEALAKAAATASEPPEKASS